MILHVKYLIRLISIALFLGLLFIDLTWWIPTTYEKIKCKSVSAFEGTLFCLQLVIFLLTIMSIVNWGWS